MSFAATVSLPSFQAVFSIFAALFFVAGVAFAEPAVVGPKDLYAGMTYGDWSAVWWQYAIQTPFEGAGTSPDINGTPYNSYQNVTYKLTVQ